MFVALALNFALIQQIAIANTNYCPVTTQLDFNDNFLYPVDIYDCRNAGTHDAPDFDELNCFSVREANGHPADYHNRHNCSAIYKVKCPIDRQFVADALKRTKAISPYSPICHLCDLLEDASRVFNVYVIGGSVTGIIDYMILSFIAYVVFAFKDIIVLYCVMIGGANTLGCCPKDECKCNGRHGCNRCTLTAYLGDYLKKRYKATVNVYNMGGLRGNTEGFAHSLRNLILTKNSQFEGFTSSDIVFLDYSGNEGISIEDVKTLRTIASNAETLLRRIYYNSEPHSFPTVIYLANLASPASPRAIASYNEYYLEFARAYNVSVWSFRDSVHATRNRSDHPSRSETGALSGGDDDTCSITDRLNALDYLDYSHYGDHNHPSWHVHMTQSDLYAAIWNHELHACDEAILRPADKSLDIWGPVASADNIAFNHAHLDRTIDDLPPPVYGMTDISKELLCDTSVQTDPLLELSYDIVLDPFQRHPGRPVIGAYRSEPAGAWALAEDVVGRGGFISSTPDAKLYLTFANMTFAEFHSMSERHVVWIAIEYLRTYESAGRVTLKFCGQSVGGMDGLWEDWTSYHVSYVQLAEIKLSSGMCNLTSSDLLELEVTYHHTDQLESLKEGKPEHFKLIAVKSCFVRS